MLHGPAAIKVLAPQMNSVAPYAVAADAAARGRAFVAANDYDATTRSMRELAARAGADPASFNRLAQALVFGWDEFARRLTEPAACAIVAILRSEPGGDARSDSDVTLVADNSRLKAAVLHASRPARGEGPKA